MNSTQKPKNIDLDSRKFFILVVTLLLFFVLPIAVLQQTQNIANQENIEQNDNSSGKVAGVSTENTSESVNEPALEAETIFFSIGILFSGISAILAIYFIALSLKTRK